MNQKQMDLLERNGHKLYYLLAGFDLITIAASIWCLHLVLGIHERSLAKNTVWIQRALRLGEISQAASQVNAPGNNVFDTHDPAAEEAKHKIENLKFAELIAREKEYAKAEEDPEIQRVLLFNYDRIAESIIEMNKEAEAIFGFFYRDEVKSAGMRMATMDRKYAKVNLDLQLMRDYMSQTQSQILESDKKSANKLARFELLFAGLIFLTIAMVTFYGHWIGNLALKNRRLIESQREQITASSKMASLGVMAAGVAHEINNPLAILLGSAGQLSKFIDQPEKYARKLESIEKSGRRISRIVQSLKKFSRSSSDSKQFSSHALADIVKEVMVLTDEKSKRFNTPVTCDVQTDVRVLCNDLEIEQVLVNLIHNAIDAVKERDEKRVKVQVISEPNQVFLRVIDSGTGIPEKIRDKLFDPFFTTKKVNEGTGLGLSVSKGILDEHKA
ncbi:MAG: ATP-binding protein, partial [Proteobacteria bacterium]|nr:ATP-binding protein [Pseudomonadota bacterium]